MQIGIANSFLVGSEIVRIVYEFVDIFDDEFRDVSSGVVVVPDLFEQFGVEDEREDVVKFGRLVWTPSQFRQKKVYLLLKTHLQKQSF